MATGDTSAWVKANRGDASELRQNISSKGPNSYYYAHAEPSSSSAGPQPTLLSRSAADQPARKVKPIDSYTVDDENPDAVKLYVELEGIGECSERVACSFAEHCCVLTVTDCGGCDYRLKYDSDGFPIDRSQCSELLCRALRPAAARWTVKPDNRVVVTLRREVIADPRLWLTARGQGADHEHRSSAQPAEELQPGPETAITISQAEKGYYYAHAAPAEELEPQLLDSTAAPPAPERSVVTISKYAVDDGHNAVKLYVELEGIGESSERVACSFAEHCCVLTVTDCGGCDYRLKYDDKLKSDLEPSKCKWLVKKNKIVITLYKKRHYY